MKKCPRGYELLLPRLLAVLWIGRRGTVHSASYPTSCLGWGLDTKQVLLLSQVPLCKLAVQGRSFLMPLDQPKLKAFNALPAPFACGWKLSLPCLLLSLACSRGAAGLLLPSGRPAHPPLRHAAAAPPDR